MSFDVTTTFSTASEAWQDLVYGVLNEGSRAAPRGLATRELLGTVFTLAPGAPNVFAMPERRLNYAFNVAEFFWVWYGLNDLAFLTRYNSKMAAFSDDGEFLHGAYGPQFREQLPYLLQTLRSDESSRQAVITCWRPRPYASKDIPCTVAMQFLLRDDHLHMITTMRSNDLWLGLPYDIFTFTMLQRAIAAKLDVAAGYYQHQAGSSHLYEEHVEQASALLDLEEVASPNLFGLVPHQVLLGYLLADPTGIFHPPYTMNHNDPLTSLRLLLLWHATGRAGPPPTDWQAVHQVRDGGAAAR